MQKSNLPLIFVAVQTFGIGPKGIRQATAMKTPCVSFEELRACDIHPFRACDVHPRRAWSRRSFLVGDRRRSVVGMYPNSLAGIRGCS